MAIPISQFKYNIIDVVSSGDLPLQALLQSNIDLLWTLNQRRSTVPQVQYLYTLADALRMGMEFVRGNIDNARTDSDSLDVKRGRKFSARDFNATNSTHGSETLVLDGSSSDDETSTRISDITNAGSEYSFTGVNGFTSGTDFSTTTHSMHRDASEFSSRIGSNRTFNDDKTEKFTGTRFHDSTRSSDGDIHSHFFSQDINIKDVIVPIRFGITSGYGQRFTHNDISTDPTVIAEDGELVAELGNVQRFQTIYGHIETLGQGNLRPDLGDSITEIGSESSTNTRNAHSSGRTDTNEQHHQSTTHLASSSVHNHSIVSGSQLSTLRASHMVNSNSIDVSHGESHDVGESNEQMTATIDYLGQLFENLKMMYTNIMEQIKAFEPQVAVARRYATNRMSTRMSPLTCPVTPRWPFNPLGSIWPW